MARNYATRNTKRKSGFEKQKKVRLAFARTGDLETLKRAGDLDVVSAALSHRHTFLLRRQAREACTLCFLQDILDPKQIQQRGENNPCAIYSTCGKCSASATHSAQDRPSHGTEGPKQQLGQYQIRTTLQRECRP